MHIFTFMYECPFSTTWLVVKDCIGLQLYIHPFRHHRTMTLCHREHDLLVWIKTMKIALSISPAWRCGRCVFSWGFRQLICHRLIMRAAKYERLIGCSGVYNSVKHHVVFIYNCSVCEIEMALVYITSKYLRDIVLYIGNVWRCGVYTQVICTPWAVFMLLDTFSHILAQATWTTHSKLTWNQK